MFGDSVQWADPEANFRSLVPAIPMLWAALGMVQPPAPGAVILGGRWVAGDSTVTVWRFALGGDTLDYAATAGAAPRLRAEWRRAGTVVARSRTEFDAAARPTGARVDFPEASARFELTVAGIDTAAVIPPAVWRGRR